MTPKVSVILPTYNRAHSLIAASMSVLTQSFTDLELIIVDDGSSEDIESVARGIGDDRVKFIRRETNGGAAAARNAGLRAAKGEYVAFQDSDDLWLPNKLRKQLDLFSRLPASVGVVTGAKVIYGRDDHNNYGPGKVCYAPPLKGRLRVDEDQVTRMLAENRVSLQNSLFKIGCYPHVKWFDSCAKANEDWEFAIRLVQHTVIYEDPEPVVLAFSSSDSISRNTRKEALGVLRILKKNATILSSHKKQHASLLLYVSRALYQSGKPKWCVKFLIAGIAKHPQNVMSVSAAVLRKLCWPTAKPLLRPR